MRSKPKPLSDQLREFIKDRRVTRYAIWKATGIDQAVLSHFMAGRRGMSLESLERLTAYLGLELRPVRKAGA